MVCDDVCDCPKLEPVKAREAWFRLRAALSLPKPADTPRSPCFLFPLPSGGAQARDRAAHSKTAPVPHMRELQSTGRCRYRSGSIVLAESVGAADIVCRLLLEKKN